MCRLFGMHTGAIAVPATFWLLDAPDSLSDQSRRNPDGAGIGTFGPNRVPIISKQPMAAWDDAEFARAAHVLRGTTFVAHVRYASTGGLLDVNTHPFLQQGRLFAHNGVLFGLTDLDTRLNELGARDLVHGQTDSERMFALITAETARHDGDLRAGIEAAIGWIADNLPLFSLNFVLATPTQLWALRYPDTHDLYVLNRPAGGTGTHRELDARSHRIRAHSEDLADQPVLIVATERMDDDPGWRPMAPGELLRVTSDLGVISGTPFAAPRHQLSLDDLNPKAAASQNPVSSAAPE
jgi:predicted glutamine amidotransferase